MHSLDSNIRDLPGIYKRYKPPLEKLGIFKIEDFLYHIPFRYDDYTIISNINELQAGEIVTIRGEVKEIKNQYTRGKFTIQKAIIKDQTGEMDIVWFNQPYLAKVIKRGDFISLSGKAEEKAGKIQLTSPDYEIGEKNFIHTGRLVPVYPETRGISSKWIRRQIFKILSINKNEITEFLPPDLVSKNKLPELYDAISKIHFPVDLNDIEKARNRLGFDELFTTQLAANIRKKDWNKKLKSFPLETNKYEKEINMLIHNLPFTLTKAQMRAINEIFSDLEKDKPMNRLLQGDVGSGKTVVATIGMYLSHLNGLQSALMAPTEILAQQHYKTISEFLSPFGVKVELKTGSTKKNQNFKLKNREKNHKSLVVNHESFDVLIGTHAVIQKDIKFKNLGLVIIDEQQRFGVEQRGILREKGDNPHVLTMTATPIPRTIALTLYGDLDLSILDEMPEGRLKIKTWLVPNEKRDGAYDWIKKQIKEKDSQVFIICPFIEESESMSSVKAATKEYERLKNEVFKTNKLGLLHGKLKAKEKEVILKDFREKKFQILVATPVVEVGIDIPDADIMLIEASERFGLSQLHQLRGRVGRRKKQAYCLLFTESLMDQTLERLRTMEKTNIGSELAELDLRLRGPGEIYGTRQSGRSLLKIANFSNMELIKKTKTEANIYTKKVNKFPVLKNKIDQINIKIINPD